MKTLFELLAVGNIVDKKEVNWGVLIPPSRGRRGWVCYPR